MNLGVREVLAAWFCYNKSRHRFSKVLHSHEVVSHAHYVLAIAGNAFLKVQKYLRERLAILETPLQKWSLQIACGKSVISFGPVLQTSSLDTHLT